MKKLILGLVAFLICLSQTPSFADTTAGSEQQIFNASVVNGTGNTVTSRSFLVSSVRNMGYWFKNTNGASAGSTAVTAMKMLGSWDDVTADYATLSTVITAPNTQASAGTITYPAIKFVRFQAIGNVGNATDTTVTAYLFAQE